MTYSVILLCQRKLFERGLTRQLLGEANLGVGTRRPKTAAQSPPTVFAPPHAWQEWASEIAPPNAADEQQFAPLAGLCVVHLGEPSDRLVAADLSFNDQGRAVWQRFVALVRSREAYFTVGAGVVLLQGSRGKIPALQVRSEPDLQALELGATEPYVVRLAQSPR